MTRQQAREARILLGLTQGQAAKLSKLPSHVVASFERSGAAPSSNQGGMDRLVSLRTALEAAGVVFIEGDHPGVRLRRAET